MSSSRIDQMTLEDLELALSQVETKSLIAGAEVEQLISRAFEDPERAQSQLLTLVKENRVERAIEILGGGRQHWHLGPQNRQFLGFFPSRDPDVKAALAQLPDALRRLAGLRSQVASMQAAFQAQAIRRDHQETRRKLTSSDEPAQTLGRKTGQSMV